MQIQGAEGAQRSAVGHAGGRSRGHRARLDRLTADVIGARLDLVLGLELHAERRGGSRVARRAPLLDDRLDLGEGDRLCLRGRVLRLEPHGERDDACGGCNRDPPHATPGVPAVEEDADERGQHGDEDEDEPRLVRAEDEGEVPDEHREDHGQGEVVVVNRPVFGAEQGGRVRLPFLLHRDHELPVRGDDHEEDVRDHDRAEHRADLEVRSTGREQLPGAPGGERDEHDADDGERRLAPLTDGPAEDVVDDPGDCETADGQRDRLPRGEIRDGRVDEPELGVEVVEDDEQREPGEPGRVRLPLEPVQRLGHLARRKAVLLRVVEPAAVYPPELARDSVLRVSRVLRRPQREIEPDEVERRADPGDARDDVQHPQADVEDVSQVRVHLFLAMATSSVQAVSSSSSRVRAIRIRSTSRISRFERWLTKTTNRNPNFSS